MASLRFTELQSRPLEFLDFTSLTLDEFQQLVPPFEAAFHARMAAWRLDGKPRTARRFTVYKAISEKEFLYSGCWCRVDQNVVLGQLRIALQSGFNRLHRRLTE